jgi:hypothetical protein
MCLELEIIRDVENGDQLGVLGEVKQKNILSDEERMLEILNYRMLNTYGFRCGRESILFASSSFLNCSFAGSQ